MSVHYCVGKNTLPHQEWDWKQTEAAQLATLLKTARLHNPGELDVCEE